MADNQPRVENDGGLWPQGRERTPLDEVYTPLHDALADAIEDVRDAAQRAPDDADVWDIVRAVLDTLRERGIEGLD